MKYEQPRMISLGDATPLIRAGKISFPLFGYITVIPGRTQEMEYEKPEIATIGDARLLVRGCKCYMPLDPAGQPRIAADAELGE